jgi:hypothetical protein
MNTLLEQLHDIEGLDSISKWPLALGWWVLLGLVVLLVIVLGWYLLRWITYRRSWKSDTLRKLAVLEKNLSEETAGETAVILSEYMRRIALRRFSRKECAGLVGNSWLQWLSENDPKKFDWEKKGVLLTEIPYAPSHHKISKSQMKELIHAAKDWVF